MDGRMKLDMTVRCVSDWEPKENIFNSYGSNSQSQSSEALLFYCN